MDQKRLELLEEMLQKSPDDSFLNYAAALEYKKYGETEKAINILKSLLVNDPEYLATYYQLGKLYEANDAIEQAINTYKKGKVIAEKQQETKALQELSEALIMLDAEDEEEW